MKNTRKKMLLSSLAMLLVALVALGSATYAWFSISKTVTANNMVVKAIATAGIEISAKSATEDFGTTVSFGQSDSSNFALKPVSWNGAVDSGYIPDGNIASPGGEYSGKFKAAALASVSTSGAKQMGDNGYFAAYKVWVRSADSKGDGTGTRVAHPLKAKVTIDGTNDTFARCQLVDESNNNKTIFADSANSSASVVTAAGSTKTTYELAKDETQVSVTGTDDSETGKPYTLIVWFDGEDEQCIDGAKGQTANITIEFEAQM